MQISASFLSIKENVKQNVEVLDKCDIDYLHLDVMDGIFVENKTYTKDEFASIIANTEKPLDVHLMVSDVKKYIDEFSLLNPDFITFHIEAVSDVAGVIKYMKDNNYFKYSNTFIFGNTCYTDEDDDIYIESIKYILEDSNIIFNANIGHIDPVFTI